MYIQKVACGIFYLCVAFSCMGQAPKPSWGLPADTSGKVYVHPHNKPYFVGGVQLLQHYVQQQLDSSALAATSPAGEYEVLVRLIVSAHGSIDHVQILNNRGPVPDQLLKRILVKSGRWMPGTHTGKRVHSFWENTIHLKMSQP